MGRITAYRGRLTGLAHSPANIVWVPGKHIATTIGHRVRDFILTPVGHCSPINALRRALYQPRHGIDELPMRKHCDALGRVLCEASQERLSPGYELQKGFRACAIRKRRVGHGPISFNPILSLSNGCVGTPRGLEVGEFLNGPGFKWGGSKGRYGRHRSCLRSRERRGDDQGRSMRE